MNASVTVWEATAPVKLPTRHCFPIRIHGLGLELKIDKGGISLLPRLPPMLNMCTLNPMPSCSKASRGLFVRPRVTSIFTRHAISPSPSLRQSPNRYAIRAGRNLPDKEFRYLRTIIVIAGVHPRFGSRLAPLPLTFGHWPGVSPYTSACALAGTCVFDKQSLGVFRCGPARGGAGLLPRLRPLYCRVPKRRFSRTPEATRLTYLCRFTVRLLLT